MSSEKLSVVSASISLEPRGLVVSGDTERRVVVETVLTGRSDMHTLNDVEQHMVVETALVGRQIEVFKIKVKELLDTRAAGGRVSPQILQNTEDALKCYERLHLSLRMCEHDIELAHRHDPK